MQQKTRYTKKSPGCEKRAAVVSRLAQYVYRKYGSMIMPNFGPVMRKFVATRQICGNVRIVKIQPL